MPPWPASKQRPHPWPPALRQSHHPSRPAVVLAAGSSSGCLIFLGWPPVCCWPRRSCWRSGGGPSCTAATNSVGPTSEPSVPQLSRLPVTTVAKCLRRIGTWSPRWPPFASLLTTAIAPTRGQLPMLPWRKEGISFYSVQVGPGRIRVDRLDPRRPIVGDPNPLQVANMLGVPAPGPMSGAFLTLAVVLTCCWETCPSAPPVDRFGSTRVGSMRSGFHGAHQLAQIRPDRPSGRLFGPMNG